MCEPCVSIMKPCGSLVSISYALPLPFGEGTRAAAGVVLNSDGTDDAGELDPATRVVLILMTWESPVIDPTNATWFVR